MKSEVFMYNLWYMLTLEKKKQLPPPKTFPFGWIKDRTIMQEVRPACGTLLFAEDIFNFQVKQLKPKQLINYSLA